jgi:hypothetical protein
LVYESVKHVLVVTVLSITLTSNGRDKYLLISGYNAVVCRLGIFTEENKQKHLAEERRTGNEWGKIVPKNSILK